MYKQTTASDEIAEIMRRELLAEEVDTVTHTSKLNHAVECVNKAASLFNDIGMDKAAEATVSFLEKLANKDSSDTLTKTAKEVILHPGVTIIGPAVIPDGVRVSVKGSK